VRRSLHRLLAAALAAALTFALSACAPDDPQARVAKIRSEYKVTLNSWKVMGADEPASPVFEGPESEGAEVAEATSAADETADDESLTAIPEPAEEESLEIAGAGEEGVDGEAPAELTDEDSASDTVLFDVIVQFDGDEPLPGVTLDITQADPFEQEQDHRRYWIDTADYHDGSFEQLTFELGGFDVEEGDVFSVDIRSSVPPEERAEYREFAEAGQ